jgi:CPA2 family monovalent cation:H+ antiporter-2
VRGAAAPAASLTPWGIIAPLARAVVFVAIALVVGATLLRWLVIRLLQGAPGETLFGAFSAVALAAAWLGHLAGLSFEFGAFIAGAVVSEASGSRMVQSIVAPFRSLFVSLFFVAMGMELDPALLRAHWGAIAVMGIVAVAVRLIGWGALGRIAGLSTGGAFVVGIALLPLGEFNIALVNAAVTAQRVTRAEHAILLGVTFVSIFLATLGGSLVDAFRKPFADRVAFDGTELDTAAALIVGYGRVGRTVGAILKRAGIPFAVIEHDRGVVDQARRDGVAIALGDGVDPLVLERVSGSGTRVVVAATPDAATNVAIARRLSTNAIVVARAATPNDVSPLLASGAQVALVPETEGALLFARHALERLGIARDAIDTSVDAHRVSTAREQGTSWG